MPFTNKIIKINSIQRKPVGTQSCIVLDTQQDWRTYVHSLALVPAIKKINNDGSPNMNFPSCKLQLINSREEGLFPICFEMQTKFSYLVLGIVPDSAIADFTIQNHFQGTETSKPDLPIQDVKRDRQMVRKWIDNHLDWVENHGVLIHA